jgi:hypothetical protein
VKRGHRTPASRPLRLALAAVATLLLAGSLAFMLAQERPHARTRSSPTDLSSLAAQLQDTIATDREREIERRNQIDRYARREPAQPPVVSQSVAAKNARRIARRWLAGYLPYEVDRLTATGRAEITATSTPALARVLLAHPPLIPPAQQGHPPPQGRALALLTTITHGGASAQVYVEVAYGLEREGFTLTLQRHGRGWLVAAFQG